MDKWNVTPNADGTVRLVKIARPAEQGFRSDYSSGVCYEPGTTVEATDYRSDPNCGHGLHFAPTRALASAIRYSREGMYNGTALVCDVDLESLVVISLGEGKVKAKFAHVLYVGDETDFKPTAEEKEKVAS